MPDEQDRQRCAQLLLAWLARAATPAHGLSYAHILCLHSRLLSMQEFAPPPCCAGCLNGGGQPKPAAGQTAAQLLEQLEVLYAGANGTSGGSCSSSSREPEGHAAVQQLYSEWVGASPGSEAARQLLHTQYHKREKTVTATLADW